MNTGPADITQWQYDEATGLLTNKLYADGKGVAYEYTSDGKLSKRTWARGDTTEYAYDPATGEMTNINYSGSTPDIIFSYDRIGRPKQITDAQGIRTFAYDQYLQLTNETIIANGTTDVIARNYDSLGRSDGFTIGEYKAGYGYDNWGRFISVESVIGTAINTFNYFYLPNSALISGYSNSVIQVAKIYEEHHDLLTQVKNDAGTNLISRFDYTNDELGRRTHRIDTAAAVTTNDFAYNSRGELTNAVMEARTFGWAFDNIGNRKTYTTNSMVRTYTANSLNQYTQITNGGLRTLSYDLDGNMTNDAVFAYSFNGENRLIMAEPLSLTNGSKRVRNSYDYMGRRWQKAVDTWNGSAWVADTTNFFLYDGYNMVQERNEPNGVIRSYVRGLDISGTLQGVGGIGGLLAISSGTNTWFYFGDANGNVTELVDGSGVITTHYEWDVYGNRINAPAAGNEPENPYGFSGQYCDKETGLDMYIFRPYIPPLGRFLYRDPIEELYSPNMYQFVKNNPIDKIDSLGRWGVGLRCVPGGWSSWSRCA